MRIISGQAKGRVLYGPKSDKIRPALDKVRQAVYNILGDVRGESILDLFAGTGSMGLEGLSRGTEYAVFVDDNTEALQLIRKNLDLCRFENASIVKLKLPQGLPKIFERFGSFDLIFHDPPYDQNLVNPTLKIMSAMKLLSPKGFIIVEHSPREMIQEIAELRLKDQRKYGQTVISFLVAGP